jgi:fused signal recognition particle receptor
VDSIPVIVYVLIAVVVLGLLGLVLLRGPKAPRGGYASTRDADDREGGPAEAPGDLRPGTAEVPEEPSRPALDRPESAASRMARLRGRLAKSNSVFGKGLLALLSRDRIDQDVWDEIEETLLLADLGTDASMELVEVLQRRVTVEGADDPALVLVVGVNGVGKTTTVGKLARVLVAEDKEVVLGAADTFRAAAADQLSTWGARVGVPTVRSDVEGADPASVAYDSVVAGIEEEADVVMIDTAGRLQNKAGLMDQLGKIKRVVEKAASVDEVLLVIDATTGQNGMTQARVFSEAVDVTGIVLTKLDGTAKGGIVVAIQRALGVPVKLIGLGEGPDDLAPFDPESFVDALLD